MATYAYRCDSDGPIEVRRPIGTAPDTVACPSCGGPSARVFSPPMLGLADRGRMAVIDRAEASGSEPAVVSSPPPSRRRAPAARPDPRTRGLPRP
ncbi:FmdB family zinc ribbon protein [Pseudonocardia acaciae]|uniref:FmdB family zinc ribbon protein n=1 Tax=Pseudonocardia acaciae TaxID=551276 RepID=UPI00048DA564|nr:FmdB family zinc ribbon protein [Pseudonocardia acaciae]